MNLMNLMECQDSDGQDAATGKRSYGTCCKTREWVDRGFRIFVLLGASNVQGKFEKKSVILYFTVLDEEDFVLYRFGRGCAPLVQNGKVQFLSQSFCSLVWCGSI